MQTLIRRDLKDWIIELYPIFKVISNKGKKGKIHSRTGHAGPVEGGIVEE